jgi:hypothetical protein
VAVRFRIYKMSLEGKIAVANMLLIIAVFLVFPRTIYFLVPYNITVMPDLDGVLALAALTSPVGWLGRFLLDKFCDQPLLAVVLVVVFVVLNAYFWGYVLAKLVRAVRARMS